MTRILFLALAALGLVAGCTSLAQLAPPVDPVLEALAAEEGIAVSDLQIGRTLYITDCARCHSPVAPSSLTPQKWETVMDRMAPLTGLDAEQDRQVRSYIRLTGARPES